MNKLLLPLVLGFFLVAPAVAQQPTVDKNDLILKQLDQISKSIAEIKKDVDAQKKDIDQLRQDLTTLQRRQPATPPPVTLPSPDERIPPPAAPTVPFRERTDATILITNTWTATANVQVNGVWYAVPVGSSKVVRVVPGDFTYRVYEIPNQATQQRMVAVGDTFRITVHACP